MCACDVEVYKYMNIGQIDLDRESERHENDLNFSIDIDEDYVEFDDCIVERHIH